jgi:hypothetical protein
MRLEIFMAMKIKVADILPRYYTSLSRRSRLEPYLLFCMGVKQYLTTREGHRLTVSEGGQSPEDNIYT